MEFANQRATPASAQARLFGNSSEGASMGLNAVQPTVFQLLRFILPPVLCESRSCPPVWSPSSDALQLLTRAAAGAVNRAWKPPMNRAGKRTGSWGNDAIPMRGPSTARGKSCVRAQKASADFALAPAARRAPRTRFGKRNFVRSRATNLLYANDVPASPVEILYGRHDTRPRVRYRRGIGGVHGHDDLVFAHRRRLGARLPRGGKGRESARRGRDPGVVGPAGPDQGHL